MKDPAFLFYPGDYLKDTQCLSEKSQVAYDRLMCAHMKNIVITNDLLEFFTKKLNSAEKSELMFVIEKTDGGFCIPWVVESICKRKTYSDSRRSNRSGKKKTYDSHMENAIAIVNVIDKEKEGGAGETNSLRTHGTRDPLTFSAEDVHSVILYLKSKTGFDMDPNTSIYQTYLVDLLRKGHTPEVLRKVIDFKVSEWLHTEMRSNLYPDTLFGEKFPKYLSQANAPKLATHPASTISKTPIADKYANR
jgi:uncharacterized phage protein (TIGR02220 family)